MAAYDKNRQDTSFGAFQNETIGVLRDAMRRVFEDLELTGLGDEENGGSFFFDKGTSKLFHYKNLSGGEKAVFDLLLDLSLNRSVYKNSIYCIDEPEAHMNTRLQARLFKEIVSLVPSGCWSYPGLVDSDSLRDAVETCPSPFECRR